MGYLEVAIFTLIRLKYLDTSGMFTDQVRMPCGRGCLAMVRTLYHNP